MAEDGLRSAGKASRPAALISKAVPGLIVLCSTQSCFATAASLSRRVHRASTDFQTKLASCSGAQGLYGLSAYQA